MHALVVVNARARRVPAARRSELVRLWGRVGDVELAVTHTALEATNAAAAAAQRGCDVVAAVGGDGTLRSVAAGLVGTATALAAVPGGTTNVVARALGLPNRPGPASAELVAALLAGRTQAVHPGWLVGSPAGSDPAPSATESGELFLANCGIGLDAAVVAAVEAHPQLKRRLGHLWFAAAAARAATRRSSPLTVIVTTADQRTIELTLDWLVVQAVGPYTFAGRRPLTLAAGPPLRPALCLVGVADAAPLALVRRLPRALGRGVARPQDANVVIVDNLGSVRVSAKESSPIQADGEFLGMRSKLTIGATAAALQLVVP